MQTIRLRRDHEDSDTYQLMLDVPSLVPRRPAYSACIASVSGDWVLELFGSEIYAMASDLGKGKSMPLNVTAVCPDAIEPEPVMAADACVLCDEPCDAESDTILSGEILASDSDAAVREQSPC